MTVRKENRGGEPRWIIDIPYQTADGKKHRYRRDAQVQTKCGAESEHRRLIAVLSRDGTLVRIPEPSTSEAKVVRATFADAVRHFKSTKLPTLKPSTRITYKERLDKVLVPRFGEVLLDELTGEALAVFDAELVRNENAPSTRRNFQILLRSVLKDAVESGLLTTMPRLPKMPRVGRKVTKPLAPK